MTFFIIKLTTLIQWNGAKGFESYPQSKPLFASYHEATNSIGRLSESGIVGSRGAERGLTFYTIQLAGHELPNFAPASAYRMLEALLGRVPDPSYSGSFSNPP
jgi:carboxypeptidase D